MLLHHVVDAAAERHGDAPALMVDGASYTFGAVARDVRRLAAGLETLCRPGENVAILAANCYAYPLAYYAVPRSGRMLLPLNQRLHAREWASQLGRAGVGVLLVEAEYLQRLRDDVMWPPSVRAVVVIDGPAAAGDLTFDDLLARGDGTSPGRAEPGPDTPAWLMFTSGTTGVPKGVLLTHRSLLAGCRHSGLLRPVLDDDVYLTAFPLCHVAGYQLITAHLRRRPAVLMRRFDAADFVAAVRDLGATMCSIAPTMIDLLLEYLREDPAGLAAVRAKLRTIGYGSAPMPPTLIRRVTETLGCELNQGYGMTELSGNVTALGAAEHRAAIAGEPGLLTSAGTPGPLVDLAIEAPDGRQLPAGQVGEIVVRGEQVCAGYHDDPLATADAFRGGWFHTGDMGVLGADGRLSVVDRLKDIIVTGGENVASREVEDALREVDGVRDVAVVGVRDERWGERVCAVVVADGAPPDPERLVAACRERLAGFKTPRSITFVAELPRTASGKVRKDVLREQLTTLP